MRKDGKIKRADMNGAHDRIARKPKIVDAAALERFKAKPYALRYAERMKGEKE